MTVHFIGAGPGAADLITIRGRDLIAASPVCLYAGSLVPEALLAHCPADARIVDTASLSLDAIIAEIAAAHAAGLDVARLHSGDLSAPELVITFTMVPQLMALFCSKAVITTSESVVESAIDFCCAKENCCNSR